MADRIIKPDSGNQLVLQDEGGSDALRIGTTGTVAIGTADINGGTVDGTTIGGTTPAAGSFTSVNATSASLNGSVVINESGANVDFRVEGSGQTYALFVDGSNGYVGINKSVPATSLHVYTDGSNHASTIEIDTTSGIYAIRFVNPNGQVGSITVSGTSTAYNTASDYRLKEDVQPMSGSIDRLKALKPVNFAWKADGSRVDGFLAHEAQEVVPEAVTGEKDAVDADGNPDYQGIDQAKLVPLLTAALQEAVAKIESLEARIMTLEATPA